MPIRMSKVDQQVDAVWKLDVVLLHGTDLFRYSLFSIKHTFNVECCDMLQAFIIVTQNKIYFDGGGRTFFDMPLSTIICVDAYTWACVQLLCGMVCFACSILTNVKRTDNNW